MSGDSWEETAELKHRGTGQGVEETAQVSILSTSGEGRWSAAGDDAGDIAESERAEA